MFLSFMLKVDGLMNKMIFEKRMRYKIIILFVHSPTPYPKTHKCTINNKNYYFIVLFFQYLFLLFVYRIRFCSEINVYFLFSVFFFSYLSYSCPL